MAEQAAKEPTMEEILASIRQIISEDGDIGNSRAEAAEVVKPVDDTTLDASHESAFDMSELLDSADAANTGMTSADNENEHMLSVDDLLSSDENDFGDLDDLNALEEADLTIEGLTEDLMTEPQVALDTAADDDYQDMDDILSEIEKVEAASESTQMPDTKDVEPVQATAAAPVMEAAMAQANPVPTPVAAPAAMATTALGAAGAGSAIEGLVAELMKPMIKEWIDTNLPTMVESRVEAEIQQIANKVISALRD